MDLVAVLTWLFDHPWVGLILLALAIAVLRVVAKAVAGGREFGLGSLRIGPDPRLRPADDERADVTLGPGRAGRDPDVDGAAPARAGPAAIVGRPTPLAETFDRVFDPGHAWEFYQDAAPEYDRRNSANLQRTHLATVDRMKAIWEAKQARTGDPALRVLDLGGGTGKLVATMFYDAADVTWTDVDFSAAMMQQFMQNLAGTPLAENLRVVSQDILRVHEVLKPESSDVILLSLLLSSMPQLPDFAKIAGLLAPGGALIVSDIAPSYTIDNPYYVIHRNGEQIALRMNAVEPLEVIRLAGAAGLDLTDSVLLYDGQTKYSFILVFHRAR
jgi:SAM-dependent methyltransferase